MSCVRPSDFDRETLLAPPKACFAPVFRDREVGGSNPLAPTTSESEKQLVDHEYRQLLFVY